MHMLVDVAGAQSFGTATRAVALEFGSNLDEMAFYEIYLEGEDF